MTPFQSTVSALCYSILRERCGASEFELDFPHNRTVRFVLEQHERMADFLRIPLVCVTLVFGLSSVAKHGKPFHRLRHSDRWRQIEAWRNAPVAACRDLIRFHESFTIYYFYATFQSGGASAVEPRADDARTAA